MKVFFEGMLAGAGVLALAQKLGDYRVDQVFIEYVYEPVKKFILAVRQKEKELF